METDLLNPETSVGEMAAAVATPLPAPAQVEKKAVKEEVADAACSNEVPKVDLPECLAAAGKELEANAAEAKQDDLRRQQLKVRAEEKEAKETHDAEMKEAKKQKAQAEAEMKESQNKEVEADAESKQSKPEAKAKATPKAKAKAEAKAKAKGRPRKAVSEAKGDAEPKATKKRSKKNKEEAKAAAKVPAPEEAVVDAAPGPAKKKRRIYNADNFTVDQKISQEAYKVMVKFDKAAYDKDTETVHTTCPTLIIVGLIVPFLGVFFATICSGNLHRGCE